MDGIHGRCCVGCELGLEEHCRFHSFSRFIQFPSRWVTLGSLPRISRFQVYVEGSQMYDVFVATNIISDCLFSSGGSLSSPHSKNFRMFERGQVFGCFC